MTQKDIAKLTVSGITQISTNEGSKIMKIVRKLRIYPSTEFLYQGRNNDPTGNYMHIKLCNCYSITGEFKATSHLELRDTGEPESRIIYFPNYNDPTFDPDETPPEINFRLHPKEPEPMVGYSDEIYDKMNKPIIIPPNTCSISLEIAGGDRIAIWAGIKESYAIIDDDGNEIPLESILPNKNLNKKS